MDVKFSEYIDNPTDCIFDNEEASALGLMFQLFEGSGTATWHRKTVEWFLVYLITELAVTPHNIRQGCNAVSILNAYQGIVQGLVRNNPLPTNIRAGCKLIPIPTERREIQRMEATRNRKPRTGVSNMHRRTNQYQRRCKQENTCPRGPAARRPEVRAGRCDNSRAGQSRGRMCC